MYKWRRGLFNPCPACPNLHHLARSRLRLHPTSCEWSLRHTPSGICACVCLSAFRLSVSGFVTER